MAVRSIRPRPPRSVQWSRLSLWFVLGITLFAALTLDLSALSILGWPDLLPAAGAATFSAAALGLGIWLNYRRKASAFWVGIAAAWISTASSVIVPVTARAKSDVAGLLIITGVLALPSLLVTLLMTRPEAREYFK